jgi:putative membrane protein
MRSRYPNFYASCKLGARANTSRRDGVVLSYVTEHWSFDPFLIVVAVVVVFHELGLHHLKRRSRPERSRARRISSLLFYAGLALLLLTVTSPIDYWSYRYFFVHMIEHILIMFFAPILIVAGAPWLPLVHGFPVGIRRRVMRAVLLQNWARPLRALGRFLTGGWVAVVLFNFTMVIWHLPALFDLAETNQYVHIWLMHASFFLTGVLFWLQIIPSYPIKPKLGTGAQIGAILGTNVVMIFLAMALSIFTNNSIYPVYNHLPGVTFSPFASQQIGAAILWVCGDFWALPTLCLLFRRLMAEEGGASAVIDKMLHAPDALGRTTGE